MTQQTEINLKMAPAGAELIVRALRSATPLPEPTVDAFVAELWSQYQIQMKAAAEAAQAAEQPQVEDAEVVAEESFGGTH